jgi:hypothetical protein
LNPSTDELSFFGTSPLLAACLIGEAVLMGAEEIGHRQSFVGPEVESA